MCYSSISWTQIYMSSFTVILILRFYWTWWSFTSLIYVMFCIYALRIACSGHIGCSLFYLLTVKQLCLQQAGCCFVIRNLSFSLRASFVWVWLFPRRQRERLATAAAHWHDFNPPHYHHHCPSSPPLSERGPGVTRPVATVTDSPSSSLSHHHT